MNDKNDVRRKWIGIGYGVTSAGRIGWFLLCSCLKVCLFFFILDDSLGCADLECSIIFQKHGSKLLVRGLLKVSLGQFWKFFIISV